MKKFISTLVVCLAAAGCSSQASPLVASLPALPPLVSALTASGSFVTRRGTTLFDGEQVYRAIGANKPDLAAGPLAKSCRTARASDAEELRNRQLGTLFQMRKAGAQIARLWAFQSLAGPEGDDFSHIDSLVDAAHEVGISLILVLENHYPECSAGSLPKDESWYRGGFAQPYDGYRRSFEAYVADITHRYANESAVVMWQIVNEAQTPQRPEIVRDFTTHMAQVIRQHDRNHLIAGGGAYACGEPRATENFAVMADAGGIDVLDVHDFGDDGAAWSTCMAEAKQVADERGLLVMVGESGVRADNKSPKSRAHLVQRKMDAAADRGVGIYLLWSWGASEEDPGPFDVLMGEPVIEVLQQEAVGNFAMRDLKSRADDPADVVLLDGPPAWHEAQDELGD